MTINKIQYENGIIAVIQTEETLIHNMQDSLDLIMTVKYETDGYHVIAPKEIFAEDFFKLRTGLAGEILQRFVNYGIKMAIYGDFSLYQSKPLHDFIYECNHGTQFFFCENEEEAIKKMEGVLS